MNQSKLASTHPRIGPAPTNPWLSATTGAATLDRVELHGPRSAVEAWRGATYHGVEVECYDVDSGFQKFELTRNLSNRGLGMLDYGRK